MSTVLISCANKTSRIHQFSPNESRRFIAFFQKSLSLWQPGFHNWIAINHFEISIFTIFIHKIALTIVTIYPTLCRLSSRILSAIIAMNSELVGLPRRLWMV